MIDINYSNKYIVTIYFNEMLWEREIFSFITKCNIHSFNYSPDSDMHLFLLSDTGIFSLETRVAAKLDSV